MQLSEAIMAGSMLCKAKFAPGHEDSNNEFGCALTMASLAVGRCGDGTSNAWHEARKQWPWLQSDTEIDCPAEHCTYCQPIDTLEELVFHVFDWHVCEPAGGTPYSLEQMVDFVRSIEPRELPDLPLSEQHRLEEIDAEREAAISGRDPIHDSNGRW